MNWQYWILSQSLTLLMFYLIIGKWSFCHFLLKNPVLLAKYVFSRFTTSITGIFDWAFIAVTYIVHTGVPTATITRTTVTEVMNQGKTGDRKDIFVAVRMMIKCVRHQADQMEWFNTSILYAIIPTFYVSVSCRTYMYTSTQYMVIHTSIDIYIYLWN